MRQIEEMLCSAFVDYDDRPIYEWAADDVKLSPPITQTGAFDVSDSRHFIFIFDLLKDDRKRRVNVLKPVRGGGSLIGDVHLPWTEANDAGPYMNIFQTDPDAKIHFKDRIKKILTACKKTRSLLPLRYEFSEIQLTNGTTLYTSGPGLANLQSKGVRYLRLDEPWMYPQGAMAEAMGRIGDYLIKKNSKVLCISQAGPRDGVRMEESDWYNHYHDAEVWEWEVQCSSCSKFFDPVFSGPREDGSYWGIQWDKIKLINGDWNVTRCAQTVRFECPHCSHILIDCAKTKSEWNRTGRYRLTTEPHDRHSSVHWEAVIFFPWVELVETWLNACNAERRGSLKPKIQFYQKRRAMFMDEESILKKGINVKRIAYEITGKWEAEKERYMSIDRQEEDLFWVEVRAWSNEESRQLYFGKCYGFAAAEKIRDDHKVQPNHTFCDSGYLPKGDNGVYLACIKYGWIATKGEDDYFFVHKGKNGRRVLRSYSPPSWGDPGMGTAEQGRKQCPLVRFSKPQMNETVQRLHDAGRWIQSTSASPEMQKEYSEQFGARVRMREFDVKTGKTKVWWKEAKNDHGRDLANMQAFGAMLRDLVPDPATERLTTSEEKSNNSDVSGVTETAGV